MHSTFVSETINAPAPAVYEYLLDPTHLPEWASGLAGTAAVEQLDGVWMADSPMGRVAFTFAERNPYGVLDHDVTLPDGTVVHNPMRVVPYGDGSELTFTLRRSPGQSDEAFAADRDMVAADLASVKRLLES